MTQTANRPPKVKRPSFLWLATEIGRAVTEAGISASYRTLFPPEPNGDGHPVLVLPGFMATDTSTGPLRKFIDKLGYAAHPWDLGRNYAEVQNLEILLHKLEDIADTTGEKVSLIGWSLGGVFARQIAKERPGLVRQVITLGSPFRGVHQPNNVAWIYNMLVRRKKISEVAPELVEDFPTPAPVPTTAIYTKEDGVVPWQLCIEAEESPIHQNIQVRGSHLGLGVNPSVLKIIANRLQYTEADWEHFCPNGVVEDLFFYPSL